MSVSDEWFAEFVDECPDLEKWDLHGYAAAAAARELVENWSDCWQEGGDAFGEGESTITKMIVSDIDETISRLREWRDTLASGVRGVKPSWWRNS